MYSALFSHIVELGNDATVNSRDMNPPLWIQNNLHLPFTVLRLPVID